MCIDADTLALMLTITTLEYNVRQTQYKVVSPKSCLVLVFHLWSAFKLYRKACTGMTVVCLTSEFVHEVVSRSGISRTCKLALRC